MSLECRRRVAVRSSNVEATKGPFPIQGTYTAKVRHAKGCAGRAEGGDGTVGGSDGGDAVPSSLIRSPVYPPECPTGFNNYFLPRPRNNAIIDC